LEPRTQESEGESMTHSEITTSNDLDRLRRECLRLRQGLWDCGIIAGMDTDGDDTPAALVSDIVPLIKGVVKDLRECYNEALKEIG